MTPAQAGVALAGDVHPDAPEKPHLCVPQALTQPSRKSSPRLLETLTQASRMSSPTLPAVPHPCAPERLTGGSRRCSPAIPGKAHRVLLYRLTKRSRIDSPQPSRRSSPTAPEKSHLLGKFEFSKVECDGKCVRTPCPKRRCGANIAASGTRLAVPDRCHLRVDISAANRRRLVLGCLALEAGSNALHS